MVKQSDCAQYQIDVPQDIKKCVATETIGLTGLQTVDYCVDLTAELLDFFFVQDKLFSKPVCKAHCVTYAQLCSTLCNIAFKSHGSNWSAKRVRGYVAAYGIKVVSPFSSSK